MSHSCHKCVFVTHKFFIEDCFRNENEYSMFNTLKNEIYMKRDQLKWIITLKNIKLMNQQCNFDEK